MELTVPFEPNSGRAHERKTTKYAALLASAKAEGQTATLSCIEMGSRGLPSCAWSAWITSNRLPSQLTKTCSYTAICASHIIWLHKKTAWPNPPLLPISQKNTSWPNPQAFPEQPRPTVANNPEWPEQQQLATAILPHCQHTKTPSRRL